MSLGKKKIQMQAAGASPEASTTEWLMSNDSGELYYSQNANASSFTKSSVDFGNRMEMAMYDGVIWVACTAGSSTAGLYYTTDRTGLSGWTEIQTASEGFKSVVRTNDRWFATESQSSDLWSTTDLTASSGWTKIDDVSFNQIGRIDFGNGHIAVGGRVADSGNGVCFRTNSTANDFSTFQYATPTGGPRWGTSAVYNKDDDEWMFTSREEKVSFIAGDPTDSVDSTKTITASPSNYFLGMYDGTYYVVYLNNWYAYSSTSASGGSWTTSSTIGSNANMMAYNGTVYAASCSSTRSIRTTTSLSSPHAWSNSSVSNGSGTYYRGISPSKRVRFSQWTDLGTASQSWG